MYKNILVPHAGTSAGDKALKHAVHIAKNNSSEILILHVVESLQKPPTFALSGTESKALVREFKKAAKQSLINRKKRWKEKQNFTNQKISLSNPK